MTPGHDVFLGVLPFYHIYGTYYLRLAVRTHCEFRAFSPFSSESFCWFGFDLGLVLHVGIYLENLKLFELRHGDYGFFGSSSLSPGHLSTHFLLLI
jgi:hypothetical protein